MSTEGHNTRVGKVAIVTGISMAVLAVCHFDAAKREESRIIPRERYEEIAQSYVPIATECVRMEDFGTRGVTQNTRDRQCIGDGISRETLDAIGDYNRYHGLPAHTGRLSKNVVALAFIGIGAIVGACGAGYREG
jgi:hypothetical protein